MSPTIVTDNVQEKAALPPTNGKDIKDIKAAAEDNADSAPTDTEGVDDADESEVTKRTPKKIYVVSGTIHEFASAREAEKFLNLDANAPADFRVIKGNVVEQKKKVSLR